jgi:hypothetical protein
MLRPLPTGVDNSSRLYEIRSEIRISHFDARDPPDPRAIRRRKARFSFSHPARGAEPQGPRPVLRRPPPRRAGDDAGVGRRGFHGAQKVARSRAWPGRLRKRRRGVMDVGAQVSEKIPLV